MPKKAQINIDNTLKGRFMHEIPRIYNQISAVTSAYAKRTPPVLQQLLNQAKNIEFIQGKERGKEGLIFYSKDSLQTIKGYFQFASHKKLKPKSFKKMFEKHLQKFEFKKATEFSCDLQEILVNFMAIKILKKIPGNLKMEFTINKEFCEVIIVLGKIGEHITTHA